MGKKRKGAKKPAAEPAPESAASLSSGSDDERKDPGAPSGDRGAPPGEATTGRVTYDSVQGLWSLPVIQTNLYPWLSKPVRDVFF